MNERTVNMKGLLRLGGWGAAATLALAVAVFTATTNSGSQRLAAAASSPSQVTAAAPSVPIARITETEAETRKLADAVRTLNSDRERLLTRIASLERNLEDVTGSIRRQVSPAPAAQPEATATTAAAATAAPTTSREPPASVPSSQTPSSDTTELASEAAETTSPSQGVDVGGAVSFEGLRALWTSTRTTNAAAVDGLKPVVVVRENTKTRNSELRLVLGPLANPAAAAQVCATLTAARRYCQPVSFEGQPLSFAAAAPAPAKRPPAAQEKKPATPPAPPQRAPARPNP